MNEDKLKVYIAAPWVHKEQAIIEAAKFTAAGYEVTSRWFTHEGDPADSAGITAPDTQIFKQAMEDLSDVMEADWIVVLNLARSEGKAFEAGVAYMSGIPMISVGPRGNIFATLGVEVDTVEEALEVIARG